MKPKASGTHWFDRIAMVGGFAVFALFILALALGVWSLASWLWNRL